MQKVSAPERIVDSNGVENKGPEADGLINASGHRQELDRNFHFINICGLGITSGNTEVAVKSIALIVGPASQTTRNQPLTGIKSL